MNRYTPIYLLIIIIITGYGCSYFNMGNTNNDNQSDEKPEAVNNEHLTEKIIVFFDPTIYQITDRDHLKDIDTIISKYILNYNLLSDGKEFIFWTIEDSMLSRKEGHRTVFVLDIYAENLNERFPMLKDCKRKTLSIISDRWSYRHRNSGEVKIPSSCIIESLFILYNNYQIDEKTEVVFITDLLQESTEYKMKLEALSSRAEIEVRFEKMKSDLESKRISFDFENVKSFTIYQARSNRITTTEKAQAIKDSWISFFTGFCKIDSEKIFYYSNI